MIQITLYMNNFYKKKKTQTLIFPVRKTCNPNNWNLNCKAGFYHEPALLQIRLSVYILYSKARAKVSK